MRRVVGALAVAGLSAAGCGGDAGPQVYDLGRPTTAWGIDPEARSSVLGHDGADGYTVVLPTRTIEGEFDEVNLLASSPGDGTAAPIDEVLLKLDADGEPDVVRSRIADVRAMFDSGAGEDADALDDWLADFDARVAANDGEIDATDFEPGRSGLSRSAFALTDETDGHADVAATLVIGTVRDAMSLTVDVRFDPSG
jgi:hypothetical protein